MSNVRKLLRSVKTTLPFVQSVRIVKAGCGLLTVRSLYIHLSNQVNGVKQFFLLGFFILESSSARLDSAIQPNHKELDTYSIRFVVAYEEVLSPVPPTRFYC